MSSNGLGSGTTNITIENVSIGLAFVLFDTVLATVLRLGVGPRLVTAAARCVIQLTVMSTVLQKIFEAENPWGVFGIACLLNLLGTFEVVVNKSERRFNHMFPTILLAMLGSTIPVSMLGGYAAMGVRPFWKPDQYIPIVGMLCGGTISSMTVAINAVMRELAENKDKVEMYLAFGASRLEAARPIAVEAVRLALLPSINQMSVIGLISIPGMMTGAILGGSSVVQAARLQMVIMFMISACNATATMVATVIALLIVFDNDHRLRGSRIQSEQHVLWRSVDRMFDAIRDLFLRRIWSRVRRKKGDDGQNGERQPLLS